MLQAPHPHPVVDAAERALPGPDAEPTPGDAAPPPRQCGRCRLMFDGDPTLYAPARPDWWACPRCRAILFGRHPAPSGVAGPRGSGDTS